MADKIRVKKKKETPQAAAARMTLACLCAREMKKETKRSDIPIPKAFVSRESKAAKKPPLSRITSTEPVNGRKKGNRSSNVPILLYLALTWRCVAKDFDTHKPLRAWAQMLGLKDPTTAGRRRISSALELLEDLDLIQVDRRKKPTPVVKLLSPSGDGEQYELPYNAYRKKKKNYYFKVPSILWECGVIQTLSGSGLTMLLILLSENAQRKPYCFPGTVFEDRYAISSSTRFRGLRELADKKLLEKERKTILLKTESAFDPLRFRSYYSLRIPDQPGE